MNGRKYKFELSEQEVNKVRDLIGDRLRLDVLICIMRSWGFEQGRVFKRSLFKGI